MPAGSQPSLVSHHHLSSEPHRLNLLREDWHAEPATYNDTNIPNMSQAMRTDFIILYYKILSNGIRYVYIFTVKLLHFFSIDWLLWLCVCKYIIFRKSSCQDLSTHTILYGAIYCPIMFEGELLAGFGSTLTFQKHFPQEKNLVNIKISLNLSGFFGHRNKLPHSYLKHPITFHK